MSWRGASESIAITLPNGITSHYGGTQVGDTVTYAISYNQTAIIDVVGNTGASVAARLARMIGAVILLILAIILAVLGFRLFRSPPRKAHTSTDILARTLTLTPGPRYYYVRRYTTRRYIVTCMTRWEYRTWRLV